MDTKLATPYPPVNTLSIPSQQIVDGPGGMTDAVHMSSPTTTTTTHSGVRTPGKAGGEFITRSAAAIRRANPDADITTIMWTHGPVLTTWADGTEGWNATAVVTARGFRTRCMFASANADGSGLTVR
jgi:hypothetical protein